MWTDAWWFAIVALLAACPLLAVAAAATEAVAARIPERIRHAVLGALIGATFAGIATGYVYAVLTPTPHPGDDRPYIVTR